MFFQMVRLFQYPFVSLIYGFHPFILVNTSFDVPFLIFARQTLKAVILPFKEILPVVFVHSFKGISYPFQPGSAETVSTYIFSAGSDLPGLFCCSLASIMLLDSVLSRFMASSTLILPPSYHQIFSKILNLVISFMNLSSSVLWHRFAVWLSRYRRCPYFRFPPCNTHPCK